MKNGKVTEIAFACRLSAYFTTALAATGMSWPLYVYASTSMPSCIPRCAVATRDGDDGTGVGWRAVKWPAPVQPATSKVSAPAPHKPFCTQFMTPPSSF